jgi:hypothetical protein
MEVRIRPSFFRLAIDEASEGVRSRFDEGDVSGNLGLGMLLLGPEDISSASLVCMDEDSGFILCAVLGAGDDEFGRGARAAAMLEDTSANISDARFVWDLAYL